MAIDDDEPIWLTSPQIVNANRVVLRADERHFLRSPLALEGALSRPWTMWSYEGVDDIFVLAARLTAALTVAHAFEQGNKRTAFEGGMIFLMTNGSPVEPLDLIGFAQLIELVAVGSPTSEADLAMAFRECSVSLLK